MSQLTLDHDPSRRVLRWRRYDRALVVAIAGALMVLGIGIHAWLTGEHIFAAPGATETTPVAVGHTLYVGLGPLRAGQPDAVTRINLRSITPLVRANSAAATVNIVECDAGRSASRELIAGGVVLDDVATYCATVDPIRTGAITVGPRADGFVLAITPHHSGVVQVDGAEMSYRVGYRSGTQRVGTVRLSAHAP